MYMFLMQGKFLKDYAQTHEALSKLGTALPTVLFGGPAGAVCSSFGSLESYSTSEVKQECVLYMIARLYPSSQPLETMTLIG